ncbi:hypothetical protein X772_03010 [Mesorhizobium sp. LSJC280B00]|nr:hypothetical protein X772_03010 [Mesorhizobium sp. LSJC280B00]
MKDLVQDLAAFLAVAAFLAFSAIYLIAAAPASLPV